MKLSVTLLKSNYSLLVLFILYFVHSLILTIFSEVNDKFLLSVFYNQFLILLILFISSQIHKIIYFVTTFLISCYIAYLISYSVSYGGFPTLSSISVILETNINEATEFLQTINLIPGILMAIFTLFCSVIFHLNIQDHKSKMYSIALAFPLLFVIEVNSWHLMEKMPWYDSIRATLKFNLISSDIYSIYMYSKYIKMLENTPDNQWTELTREDTKPKYYILVIGESASKYHHSYYGYPRETTPLLMEREGLLIIDGAYAAAPQTTTAISRMLTLNNGNAADYSYNAIDLMNSVGMSTHWVSNQELIGIYENPVSILAKYSDKQYFVGKGYKEPGYNESGYDELVLAPLKEIIAGEANPNGDFIVVHLMGSHPNICARSPNQYFTVSSEDKRQNNTNCYDNSIRYTDYVLNSMMTLFEDSDAELLYISDHSMTEQNVTPYFSHGISNLISRRAFEIPLLFWDSTASNEAITLNREYYARNLIHTLADWTGIVSTKLDPRLSVINDEYQEGTCNDYSLTSELEKITFSSQEVFYTCGFSHFMEPSSNIFPQLTKN